MDSGSLVRGSRVQGGNLRRAMVWHVSQAGLHKDHYSSSHTGGPEDSGDVQLSPFRGDVQLSPFPVSFHKSV